MVSNRIVRSSVAIAGYLIMAFALYMLADRFTSAWSEIALDLPRMQVAPLVGASLLTLTMLLMMSLGWTRGLHAVGVSIRLRWGFSIYYQASFLRYLPGSVWHLPGRSYLCQQQGISLASFAQSTFLELFFLLSTGGVLAGWGLAVYSEEPLFIALSGLSIAAMVIIIVSPYRVLAVVGRRPVDSASVNRRALVSMPFIYFGVWLAYGSAIDLVFLSLPGVQVPQWLTIVAMNTVAWAAGFFSLSPSGLGVRELSLSVMFGSGMGDLAVMTSITQRIMELLFDGLLWLVAKLGTVQRQGQPGIRPK